MFDQSKLEQLKSRDVGSGDDLRDLLGSLDEDALRALKYRIEDLLPKSDLQSLNLERELVDQYYNVLALQRSIFDDNSVPANQKAQCANSTASVLRQLIDMQVAVARDERLKKIEGLLLECIVELPKEARDRFFEKYEEAALAAGVTT